MLRKEKRESSRFLFFGVLVSLFSFLLPRMLKIACKLFNYLFEIFIADACDSILFYVCFVRGAGEWRAERVVIAIYANVIDSVGVRERACFRSEKMLNLKKNCVLRMRFRRRDDWTGLNGIRKGLGGMEMETGRERGSSKL